MPIKIAITDDHPLAIAGLQNMLSTEEGMTVVDTYNSGEALMAGLEQNVPDVLLLDIHLQDSWGQELADIISKKYPTVKILAISSYDAPTYIKSMMHHGCHGYILKNADLQTLALAINKVYNGEEYIDPSLKEKMMQNVLQYKKNLKARNRVPHLSKREREILKLIVEEFTNQEIADKLFISLRTVEGHRSSLLLKLDVKNSIGLVRMAIQMGLVE